MAANFRVPFKMAIFTALFFISNTVLKKVRQQYDIMTDALREKGKRRVKNEQFEVS